MADARGAIVSKRMIALAAIEGRQLRFMSPAGWIDGWTCGLDDYHYKVVNEAGVHLVHKTGTVVTQPHDSVMLKDLDPAVVELLDPIIAPFRTAMEKDRRPSPEAAQGAPS